MATLIRDGPGQSEEPGTPSVSSTWLAGAQEHLLLLFQENWQGAGSEMKQLHTYEQPG